MQALTKGNGKDNWSISELVQALILLSHFHALSSFVFGCGLKSEIDHNGGFTYRPPSVSEPSDTDYSSDHSSNGQVKTI